MPDDAPTAPEHEYVKVEPQRYKPAYKPYVPQGARSTAYTKPYAPAVQWQPAPVEQYWWQK